MLQSVWLVCRWNPVWGVGVWVSFAIWSSAVWWPARRSCLAFCWFWSWCCGTVWRGGSRWPTLRGSRHLNFGESTVYETCLCLEVEPVRRMLLFSQRRPLEVPDQSRAVLLAARVGAKAVSLHPQSLRSCDYCQPLPCGREVGGEAWLGHQVP